MPKTVAITPSWYWPPGVPRATGIPPYPLHALVLDRWARHRPGEAALAAGGDRLTWAQLDELVRVAAAREDVAVPPGPSVDGVIGLLAGLAAGRRVRLDQGRAEAEHTDGLGGPAVALGGDGPITWHSHRSLVAGAISMVLFLQPDPARGWLSSLGLGSWAGLFGALAPLWAGSTLVLPGAEPVADVLGREEVGYALLGLDEAVELAADKRGARHLRGSLQAVLLPVAGAFEGAQRRRVARAFDCPSLTVFGLPETGPIFASHPSWYIDESVGIPVTNVNVVPADPRSGAPIQTLWELVESAMVTVRSPIVACQNGSALKRTADGRLATGVIASSDANGMVYLLPD